MIYTSYTMIQQLNDKDKRAFALIRNKLAHYGESPSLREINEVTGGKSPRSASLVIDRLIKAGLIKKIGRQLILIGTPSNSSIRTVGVPLVGAVACGTPMLAEENVQAYIPVSTALAKKGSVYFFLRAVGDSMNKAGIKSGDLLLVRQQVTAEDGDKVVALINDEATVKIFEQADGAVVLRPKSSNKKHKPIILTDDFMIQGMVVAVLPGDLQ
jgi:repressor LexA